MERNIAAKKCALIGAPVQSGTHVHGCLMGPDALRTAGVHDALEALGHRVTDFGNLAAQPCEIRPHHNANVRNLGQTYAWIKAVGAAALDAANDADMTLILGGDHSVSAGSVPAFAKVAAEQDCPLFVLWLDAHPDMHRLETTESGNLHGTPVAYLLGCEGFERYYPPLMHRVSADRVCMIGLRSVDPAERALIVELGVETYDMRAIDEHGIKAPLSRLLDRVWAENGCLHVSLDVDFLDPTIACAVGTTVPGGATFREAQLIMELLHDSGLVRSLDLVELNPVLDDHGKTARLIVDLTASLMGRTALDRPTLAK